jgi:hypothetical protein
VILEARKEQKLQDESSKM